MIAVLRINFIIQKKKYCYPDLREVDNRNEFESCDLPYYAFVAESNGQLV